MATIRRRFALGPLRFAVAVGQRYVQDHGPSHAAALTFSTLLALVPLASIAFAIFAGLPVFDRLLADFERFIADNLAPQLGQQASDYLLAFVANTRQLTFFSTAVLSVGAIALLLGLQRAFNVIWRVQMRRPSIARTLGYAVAVVFGPLLIGLSATLTGLVSAGLEAAGGVLPPGTQAVAGRLLPAAIAVLAFWGLYLFMPRRPVQPQDALLGALVATVLFELANVGFGAYVTVFPAYRTIYGALSSVPVFLIWLFLVWTVTLIGAEVCAVREDWRLTRARRELADTPLRRLLDALAVVAVLDADTRYGDRSDKHWKPRPPGALRFNALSARSGLPGHRLETALALLTRSGLVRRRDATGRWALGRDLREARLLDLARRTGVALDTATVEELAHLSAAPLHRQWLQPLKARLLARASRDDSLFDLPLSQLMRPRQ